MMLSLVVLAVVSQSHSPKIIEIGQGKPVPVLRQENVVRPVNSKSVKPATSANDSGTSSSAQATTTVTNTEAKATDDAAAAQDDQAKKEREAQAKLDQARRQREIEQAAEATHEEWRNAANALSGN
jgi:hypothetical protein